MLTANTAVAALSVRPTAAGVLVLAPSTLRTRNLLHLLVAQAHVLVVLDSLLREVLEGGLLVIEAVEPALELLEHRVLDLGVARGVVRVEERLEDVVDDLVVVLAVVGPCFDNQVDGVLYYDPGDLAGRLVEDEREVVLKDASARCSG